MKKLIQFMVIFFVIAAVSSGFAQIRPGAFSVSPVIGGYLFENNQDFENRLVYGLRLGYDITKHVGVEAAFDYVNTNYKPLDVTTNFYNYRLEGLYHFLPDKKLVPYLAVGAGGSTINYPDRYRKALVDYGVGLKYFLADWLAIRADVRHLIGFNSVYNNLEYTLGLVFYFGGTKATAASARQAEAAPVVAAEPAPAPPAPPVKEPEPAPAPPAPPVKEPEPAPAPPPVQEMKKAPEAASVAEQKILEKGRVQMLIEFDTGKAIVKPKYYKEIEAVADVMKKYPDMNIVIEGHTDNVGGKQYNQGLSQKRADAIKKVMVTKYKIPAKRLTAKGFGMTKPIASNATKEGKQQNRRVEAAAEYIKK